MSTLEIRDLHVTVDADGTPKEILRGVDLTVSGGETHALYVRQDARRYRSGRGTSNPRFGIDHSEPCRQVHGE